MRKISDEAEKPRASSRWVRFSKFQDDGWLEVKQRQIRILDSAPLRNLVSGSAC